MKTFVLSLGGSLICPDKVDVNFLRKFKTLLDKYNHRFVIICGGGRVCRDYQNSAKILKITDKNELDWIGIMSSRLNGELVRTLFGNQAFEKVVYNPDENFTTDKKIIMGAGFEPGASTDLRAVQFGKRFGAKEIINLSNVEYVYTGDPKINKNAKKIKKINWTEFRILVGNEWNPGANLPFDPIAAREAQKNKQTVFIVGANLSNLVKIIEGMNFKGTIIQ